MNFPNPTHHTNTMTTTAKPTMIATALPVLFTHAGMEYYLVNFSFEGLPGADHNSADARECLLAAGHTPAKVRGNKVGDHDLAKEPAIMNRRGWIALFDYTDHSSAGKQVRYLDPREGGVLAEWFYSIQHRGGNNHHPALCQRPVAG